MADGMSVVNMGELSKPASLLIEKVSDALGGYFKPYQIRRVAKAEAEAKLIQAQTQTKITELQRRALLRWIGEETRKQKNIESITNKSFPYLTDTSNPQNMDTDWIANFFEKCRNISDEQMQLLWARILAGEANIPGNFSRRTIDLVSSIEKEEARSFTNLCGFLCTVNGELFPIIYSDSDPIYNAHQVNFDVLSHLGTIGLINFEPLSGFVSRELPQIIDFTYQNKSVKVTLNTIDRIANTKYQFNIGQVLLTHAGLELSAICTCAYVDGFLDYLTNKIKSDGASIS